MLQRAGVLIMSHLHEIYIINSRIYRCHFGVYAILGHITNTFLKVHAVIFYRWSRCVLCSSILTYKKRVGTLFHAPKSVLKIPQQVSLLNVITPPHPLPKKKKKCYCSYVPHVLNDTVQYT